MVNKGSDIKVVVKENERWVVGQSIKTGPLPVSASSGSLAKPRAPLCGADVLFQRDTGRSQFPKTAILVLYLQFGGNYE